MKKKDKKKAGICPKCDAKAIPIVYGLPGPGLFKKAERGEVYLGGCMIMPDNPQFRCPKCNHQFGSDKKLKKWWSGGLDTWDF